MKEAPSSDFKRQAIGVCAVWGRSITAWARFKHTAIDVPVTQFGYQHLAPSSIFNQAATPPA